MSILINGIDMPKACVNECPLAGLACLLWKELGKDATERRHENCPIVEIPPHGRLIDADALIENWWKEPQDWMDKDQVLFHITGIRAEISNAPTIIEADIENTSLIRTNADRIRAMTDEELLAFIFKPCPKWNEKCQHYSCHECLLEWLKQEVVR